MPVSSTRFPVKLNDAVVLAGASGCLERAVSDALFKARRQKSFCPAVGGKPYR